MSKVKDFLAEAGVFFLATVDGNQSCVRSARFWRQTESFCSA